MDKKQRIEELVNELNRYAYEYYSLDNPSVSDKDYDKKYDELKKLEEETNYVLPYSPTLRVGDRVLEGFNKYTHKARLWSLDKAQSLEELKDWHNRNLKFIREMNSRGEDLPEPRYVLTKKFDGLTVNLTYDENGILASAATRGNGELSVKEKMSNFIFYIKRNSREKVVRILDSKLIEKGEILYGC